MRGLARIYDVRMAQFVLKIEKLSHIMGPRASQDSRSPSPFMAPGVSYFLLQIISQQANGCYLLCLLRAKREEGRRLSLRVSHVEAGANERWLYWWPTQVQTNFRLNEKKPYYFLLII